MRSVCGLAVVFLALSAGTAAQDFDFEKDRQPAISLNGLWRFHTGDNPDWAKPDFDDSHWSLLRSDKSWDQQGYKGYTGMAWYRFRVRGLRKGPLAIYLNPILCSYHIFANGRLIGIYGDMPPHAAWYGPQGLTFDVPQDGSSTDVAMAIRVWHDPKLDLGGGARGGRLGAPDLIAATSRQRHFYMIWSENDVLILSILEALAGLAALSLFLLRRSEYEYIWFALMQFAASTDGWFEFTTS